AVLPVHERVDCAAQIPFGKVDFAVSRPYAAIRPKQPGGFVARHGVGAEADGVAAVKLTRRTDFRLQRGDQVLGDAVDDLRMELHREHAAADRDDLLRVIPATDGRIRALLALRVAPRVWISAPLAGGRGGEASQWDVRREVVGKDL